MNVIIWILQILLALVFIGAGLGKLTQPINRLEKRMQWVNALPVGVVRWIGLAEFFGGLGLILPAISGILTWLTPLAAAGLAVVMALAAIFHTNRREFNMIVPNVVLLVLALIIAVGRGWIAPL